MKFSKIVLIDDEPDILDLLQYNLEKERAQVKAFCSGLEAMAYISNERPDVIVCDWMMDDIDGLEMCRQLKMNQELCCIPFVMLTAKDHEADIVSALEMGAEDYIVKPVKMKELIVRLKKILKRQKPPMEFSVKTTQEKPEQSDNLLKYKEIKIDVDKHQVHVDDKNVDLTYSEFKLLQLLISRSGRVYSRNQIIEKLNGMDYIATERSVDVQIVGLRKKIGSLKNYLETVRGVGYRMKD
ncbi:MAG: response regulator transcription factor [Cyclobacteriaceae bacterium]